MCWYKDVLELDVKWLSGFTVTKYVSDNYTATTIVTQKDEILPFFNSKDWFTALLVYKTDTLLDQQMLLRRLVYFLYQDMSRADICTKHWKTSIHRWKNAPEPLKTVLTMVDDVLLYKKPWTVIQPVVQLPSTLPSSKDMTLDWVQSLPVIWK